MYRSHVYEYNVYLNLFKLITRSGKEFHNLIVEEMKE